MAPGLSQTAGYVSRLMGQEVLPPCFEGVVQCPFVKECYHRGAVEASLNLAVQVVPLIDGRHHALEQHSHQSSFPLPTSF